MKQKRSGLMTRFSHREEGYALITALLILSVLSMLMVVTLATGASVNNLAERGTEWTRVLGVSESGMDNAVAALSVSRNINPVGDPKLDCDMSGGDEGTTSDDVCTEPWGEYEVEWELDGLVTTVTATGYYPSKSDSGAVSRTIEAVYEPEPIFKYALFSASSLEVKNNSVIHGDVYGGASIHAAQNFTVCGSLISPGAITGGSNQAEVVTDDTHSEPGFADSTCTGADADIWGGADITVEADVDGDVTSSGGATCEPPARLVTSQTIAGTATSCGSAIGSSAPTKQFPRTTAPPDVEGVPEFTYNPANYPVKTCYPAGASCDQADQTAGSAAALTTALGTGTIHSGTHVAWQPITGSCLSAATPEVQIPNMTISDDLTIITNTRIDLGNQGTFTYTGTDEALVTLISICNPTPGTTCDVNNDQNDCAIWAFNGAEVVDASGNLAALLYTPGPIGIKNNGLAGGALYGGTLNNWNNIFAYYDPLVLRVLGFGAGFVRVSWMELDG